MRSIELLLGVLLIGVLSAAPAPPAARAAEASTLVAIILQDGTEIIGEIVSESDAMVVLKTSYAKVNLARTQIKEIKRNLDPAVQYREEWRDKWERVKAEKDVKKILDVAHWGTSKGLTKEVETAFARIIELDPEHEEARTALGHAKFEGAWVDAEKVKSLVAQGYVREGANLIKPAGGNTTAVDPEFEPGEPSAKELTARAKAHKKLEKYRKRREEEFKGVDISKAWRKPTEHYDIWCDSTLDVTKVYMWIMEALYATLNKRFEWQPDARAGGRLGVRIYKTQKEFLDESQSQPGTGAFYNPGNETLYAFHGPFAYTCTTFNTLAHEATHQFQGRKLGASQMSVNLPRFIAEGMAVYFGDAARLDPEKKRVVTGLIPRDRLLPLKRKIDEGTKEKLRDMLMVIPNGAQYSDAWAFVRYLFDGPKKKAGLDVMVRIWVMAGERRVTLKDIETIVEKDFGTIEALDKEITTFTMTLVSDPTGEVTGDLYDSFEFKCSMKRPSPEWTMHQDSENSQIILYLTKNDDRQAPRIDLRLESKADPFETDDSFLRKVTVDNPQWNMLYEQVEQKTQDLTMFEGAFEVTYRDKVAPVTPPPPPDPSKPPPPPQPGPAQTPIDQKKPRIYREYWAFLPDRAYVVRGSALEADFPAFERILRKAADTLEVKPENRW